MSDPGREVGYMTFTADTDPAIHFYGTVVSCRRTVASVSQAMAGGAVMGTKIEIKAGAETDVTVEMMPLGVVVSRVVDQYGDPVRHAIVRTEDKMSLPGQDQYYESYASALTDDLGQYRVADVEPGKHQRLARQGIVE